MKVLVIAIGKPGRLLEAAMLEYERRAARYWDFEAIEVKEYRSTGGAVLEMVREKESERQLKRVPDGAQIVAVTRVGGDAFSSERFARHLDDLAARGVPAIAFLIGGAFGLGNDVLVRADRRIRLSAFTLTHDLARLVLAEQLYRAGTILKGEPYHKGD